MTSPSVDRQRLSKSQPIEKEKTPIRYFLRMTRADWIKPRTTGSEPNVLALLADPFV